MHLLLTSMLVNAGCGSIALPDGDSQAASAFDELLIYLQHSARESGFSIIAPVHRRRRLDLEASKSRLLLCGDESGKLVNGLSFTSCTWRAQAFRGDDENGWVWQLIYDIHNHEAFEPELNDNYFPLYHDIGEKASTPMTDQTHVALLEAILRFDGLDNFGYWFSCEHPETKEYLNIRNIRPAYIRSSLFGEGNGQDSWETIRAKYFPHIQPSESFVGRMAVGQYLTGLFNLDGFIRKEEYLNESSLIAGLNLAIGQHKDVRIIATPLVTALGPSQLDVSIKLLTSLSTVIALHFDNHWAIIVAQKKSSSLMYFDS